MKFDRFIDYHIFLPGTQTWTTATIGTNDSAKSSGCTNSISAKSTESTGSDATSCCSTATSSSTSAKKRTHTIGKHADHIGILIALSNILLRIF